MALRADEPHPQVELVLEQLAALEALPLSRHGARGARDLFSQFNSDADEPEVGRVHDFTVPGYQPQEGDQREPVPVRHYRPVEADESRPTVVYYHGGGFVVGSLDSHDVTCRHICKRAGVNVVSADYRLAPEDPFPAAVEDAYAVASHVQAHPEAVDGDGTLAVMGDSAGGNLAAVVAQLARDRREDGTTAGEPRERNGEPAMAVPDIDRQVLIYPAVDARQDRPSWEQNKEGYFLVEEDLRWFSDCYFGSDLHQKNPYAFPLAGDCHDLPPATVVTAGFDPLRDEGIAYAEALEAASVEVEHRNYNDVVHGFFSMLDEPAELERAHEAMGDVCDSIRRALDVERQE
ncbi:MAG: alpha/beta hydrolase [Haloglomus sp.]